MADFIYNAYKLRAATSGLNLTTGVYRCLLLSAHSDVNADDDDLATALARAGTTEIDVGVVTGYTREALTYVGTTNQAGSVEADDTNDRIEWRHDAIEFDLSPAGTPVGGIIYLDIAGDDSSDATAIPAFHFDLPGTELTSLSLSNGADGLLHIREAAA